MTPSTTTTTKDRKTKGKKRIQRLSVGSNHGENWNNSDFKELLEGERWTSWAPKESKQMKPKREAEINSKENRNDTGKEMLIRVHYLAQQ